jgi:hypothetical protein
VYDHKAKKPPFPAQKKPVPRISGELRAKCVSFFFTENNRFRGAKRAFAMASANRRRHEFGGALAGLVDAILNEAFVGCAHQSQFRQNFVDAVAEVLRQRLPFFGRPPRVC